MRGVGQGFKKKQKLYHLIQKQNAADDRNLKNRKCLKHQVQGAVKGRNRFQINDVLSKLGKLESNKLHRKKGVTERTKSKFCDGVEIRKESVIRLVMVLAEKGW